MNLESDSIHCGICYTKYDREQRPPLSLPQCGHTCCKECTNQILRTQQAFCPFCKKGFIVCFDGKYLQPQVNYAVLSSLEEKHLFGVCELHNVPYEYLCEDDRMYACSKCCISGKHQGHRTVELQVAKKDYDTRLQVLEDEKKQMKRHVFEVQTLLEKRESRALKQTDNFFDKIEDLVKKQRQERKTVIVQKFENEKKWFNSHLYTARAVERSLRKYKTVTPEKLCKIKSENFLEVIKNSGNKDITKNIQAYISAFKEIPEDVIPSDIDNHSFKLPEIHFPNKIFPNKDDNKPAGILLTDEESCLEFEITEDKLMIKIARTEKRVAARGAAIQQNIKHLSLVVENIDLSATDNKFLCQLLNSLSDIQSISIEFSLETVSSFECLSGLSKELANLMSIFLSKTNEISSLCLIWSSSYGDHIIVDLLVSEILPSLPQLESLEVNMPNSKMDHPLFAKLEMTTNLMLFNPKGIKMLLNKFRN